MPRHALHARSLGFIHPSTHKEMHFESELPDEFKRVLEKWDTYCSANTSVIKEVLEEEVQNSEF